MKDTQRERQRHRQREKQAPCKEPDVGLNPGSPGSHPGLKAGAKPLSHLGCPVLVSLFARTSRKKMIKAKGYMFLVLIGPARLHWR